MKILIFLHGTSIMHKNAKGRTREEIVKQVIEEEESVKDFSSYIPVGGAVNKIQKWREQGAEICYLSSHTDSKSVRADKTVLKKHGFTNGKIYYRKSGEEYKDVVERIKPLPNVLIEDDCKSIGGEVEMTYPHLKSELKTKIKSIVVKEFSGIDHLPDKLSDLLKCTG